jgi:hypothetical protein
MVHGGAARLLRNDGGNARNWLRVVLRGGKGRGPAGRRSTTHATGALVRLTTTGGRQLRPVGAQSSYLSQEPPGEAFFGLGSASTVESLEIVWPSGRTQTFGPLPARTTVHVEEGGSPRVERGP